jgi:hypothetical protein
MGLFDRFRRNPNEAAKESAKEKGFFLEPDKASSLGDVDFMRRSYSIRHTFPGTADNPGLKERVEEVDSMAARLEKVSDGLPGGASEQAKVPKTSSSGVPKEVKKTFAQQISQQEFESRIKGSAVAGTNVPGSSSRTPAAGNPEPGPAISRTSKPGSIDPFRDMVKDLG